MHWVGTSAVVPKRADEFLLLTFQGEKTRQEILNDIIAKSKERKLEKARGKEEQESERERLDEGMEELLGMLHQRPSKGERGERSTTRAQSDDYDLTMRVRLTPAEADFNGIRQTLVTRLGVDWLTVLRAL